MNIFPMELSYTPCMLRSSPKFDSKAPFVLGVTEIEGHFTKNEKYNRYSEYTKYNCKKNGLYKWYSKTCDKSYGYSYYVDDRLHGEAYHHSIGGPSHKYIYDYGKLKEKLIYEYDELIKHIFYHDCELRH